MNTILCNSCNEISLSSKEIDAIYKCFFNRAIIYHKDQDYSIVLLSSLANTYCGQKGRKVVEGENGITFNFKKFERSGTTPEVGNFPELYYYIH